VLAVNLKELIKSYDQNLLDNLRGFGKEDEFLKFWVPGIDEYQSFLNLVDALVETEITEVKMIFEINNKKNLLFKNIETFLLKVSTYKKETDKGFLNLIIKIDKSRYKNILIAKNSQNKKIKKQKTDTTKHVSIFGIKENIKLLYKKNLELFNPKSFYSGQGHELSNVYIEYIEYIKIGFIIENDNIVNLYHNSNKNSDLQKLVDILFEIINEKNIQEAKDHGVIYLEEKIRLINDKIKNDGVVLPGQAGMYFNKINTAIRNIYNNYKLKNNIDFDINKNYFKTSVAWKNLDYIKKVEKINLILKEICRSSNLLNAESVSVNKIESDFKIYLNIDKDFSKLQEEKNILLNIEVNLKKLDNTLEVFIEEILDLNKLRLKNSPQKNLK
tara:strand:- start:995 stop:2152 length:1158 start_codon:yes stop_codon:yes gene_type:complete